MLSWGQLQNSVACCCSGSVLSDSPLRFQSDQADLETISRTSMNDRIRAVFCVIENQPGYLTGVSRLPQCLARRFTIEQFAARGSLDSQVTVLVCVAKCYGQIPIARKSDSVIVSLTRSTQASMFAVLFAVLVGAMASV
jgi:hypothetical protein